MSDGTRYFAYDDENQLNSVTVSNAWRSQFVYDGKLRKRIERDYSWSGSSWRLTNEIHLIYDGNVVIQERDTNNLPKVTYTRGNDLSGTLQGAGGIGGLLARSDNSQMIIGSPSAHMYYHADGNGNVTALINNLQLIVAKYQYDPFGNTLSISGPLASANEYRFSSKEWNDNSGLYYYLYRFYDPSLQRWLNRDPIGERGGINLYDYIGNNPVNKIDPLGLIGTIAEDLALVAAVGEEEAAETIGPAAARAAAQAIERKAAEEVAKAAAQALERRCISNVGKLANRFKKTPKEIKDALHEAKKALQGFKGKGMKGNVDVTVDPTTGEIYPQVPGGGLGDSIGNISGFLP